jgi:hypothetical protein
MILRKSLATICFGLQGKEIKKHVLRAALKNGVEKGALVQVKASYKLSADAKAAVRLPLIGLYNKILCLLVCEI